MKNPNYLFVLLLCANKKKKSDRCRPCNVLVLSLQKELYMIAAGVIGGVFLLCTVVMFLGVKEREGEITEISH